MVGPNALTVRALLAQHRRFPQCNAGHGIMDPLGLSLENFDAIGQWRVKDRFAGEKIDASATMANGDKMNGVVDLRAQLMRRPEQFVALTEKLMVYSLGRSVDWRDMPTIRAIAARRKVRTTASLPSFSAWSRASSSGNQVPSIRTKRPPKARRTGGRRSSALAVIGEISPCM